MKKYKSITILSILAVLLILGTVFACVSLVDGELGVYNYNRFPEKISLGLDLSGGIYAEYEVDVTSDDYSEQAVQGTKDAMADLLFNKGYTEAVVSVSGNIIRVEIPDVDDPERIFELIGNPAELEFKEYVDGKDDLSLDDKNGQVKLEKKITGDDVAQAGVQYNQTTGYYEVVLQFTAQGAKDFATATTALTGKRLAIYINGKALIAPQVNEAISAGTCSISGNYSYEDAYDLAVQITAGSFPLALKMRSSKTISATLGVNAIKAGLIAGIAGVILIMLYLILLYRLMGVAASLTLWWYTLTFLFFLAVFPWVQLTLSGIAGVLLAIGMAVDANVIIFERIKEEYAMGKTMRTAVSTGFRRSLGAIIDGNITTIIGALVLIILGTSALKSFGITLLIGIILSLISALAVARLVLACIMSFTKESQAHLYALEREENTSVVAEEVEVQKEEV